ncbi:hypothetical protein F5Y16DRAFT_85169 [Xylariaceae sp. FL0255]|nr:hypothetical protein F5Y16DRAFT_85169 [Xylariaceae sp. FL0255]
MSLPPVTSVANPRDGPDLSFFEAYEPIIRVLYLEQDKSLIEVKRVMEEVFNFPVLEMKLYKYGVKHLGFVKKMSLHDWLTVEAHIEQRKQRYGKDTEIFLSGIKIPRKTVDRILSRNPKRHQARAKTKRICLIGRTPELPTCVRLRTPSPVSTYTRNGYELNASLLIPPVLDFNKSAAYVRNAIYQNPDSVWWLFADAPTNHLWNTIAQNLGIPLPGTSQKSSSGAEREFARAASTVVSQQGYESSYRNSWQITHQASLISHLMRICSLLANGFRPDKEDALGMSHFISFIKLDRSFPFLQAFFSLDFPVVYATWRNLMIFLAGPLIIPCSTPFRLNEVLTMRLVNNTKDWDAFRIIVEIGLRASSGAWIKENVNVLIRSLANAKSKNLGFSAERLLRTDYFGLLEAEDVNDILFHVALNRDCTTMLKLLQAGARFRLPEEYVVDGVCTFCPSTLVCLLSGRVPRMDLFDIKQFTSLLLMADFPIDCRWYFEGDCNEPDDGSYLLDTLWSWYVEERDLCYMMLYESMVFFSQRSRCQFTVSETLFAARRGTIHLQLYLEQVEEHKPPNRQSVLQQALSHAARKGFTEIIRSLTKVGVDINTPLLSERDHPLIQAAVHSHVPTLETLVMAGANTKALIDWYGFLDSGVGKRKAPCPTSVVKYLVHKGIVDGLTVDSFMDVLLNQPVDEELTALLLKSYVPIDSLVDGKNLIHLALEKGCGLGVVKFLYGRGVKIHSYPCPKYGKTILHSAVDRQFHGDREVKLVQYLLDHGADCSKEWGGPTILELVLQSSESTDVLTDWDGSRHFHLFRMLVDHGAQITGPKTRLPGVEWCPILAAILRHTSTQENIEALAIQILQLGPDIDSRGTGNKTPLQIAAWMGYHQVVHQLVRQGADVNAPAGKDGFTALQAACNPQYGGISLGLVQLLLDEGADVNAPSPNPRGLTALQCSIEAGSNSLLSLLLDAGAAINAKAVWFNLRRLTTERIRALDIAAAYGRLDMVDFLIKCNALSQHEGETGYDGAIKMAEECGHHPIAQLLRNGYKERVKKSHFPGLEEHGMSGITNEQDLNYGSLFGAIYQPRRS